MRSRLFAVLASLLLSMSVNAATLGPDLIPDPNFDSSGSWNVGIGFTRVENGQLIVINNTSFIFPNPRLPTVVGKTYQYTLTVDLVNNPSGGGRVTVGAQTIWEPGDGTGTFTGTVVATDTGGLVFNFLQGYTGRAEFDYVSVKEVIPAAPPPAGDLAPYGNPDGQVNAADALVLQRFINGNLVPTTTERLIGDVAPLGAPDGTLDVVDMLLLTRASLGLVTLPSVNFAPVFSDGFESGGLASSQNNFIWVPDGGAESPVVTSAISKTGSQSLEFAFPGDGAGNPDTPASRKQQSFSLGANYSDVLIDFDLYIPTNFTHRASGGTGQDNPFFVLYADAESADRSEGFVRFRSFPSLTGGAGSAYIPVHLKYDNVDQGPDHGGDTAPYVNANTDTGQWHNWKIHVRYASSSTANDGAVEMWKNGFKVMEYIHLANWNSSANYFNKGELFGLASTGYANDTSFNVDNFSVTSIDEADYGLNPNIDNKIADNDRDFVSNWDEVVIHGTDPNVANPGLAPDSDGDGVVDVVELALGTDPNVADSIGLDTPALKQTLHAINRLTFGPTNDLIAHVQQIGISSWIDEELTPITLDETVPDPAQVLRDASVHRFSEDTYRFGAIRPVHTNKQLQARMAWFWDNHFNTAIQVSKNANSELWEEDQFFLKAFGSFRDLLKTSAKSQAMLRYLDLYRNTKNAFNENYPREVMELHTLGQTVSDPNAVYDAMDIAELARILTGWTWNSAGPPSRYGKFNGTTVVYDPLLQFNFNSNNNDLTAKTFLGDTYGSGLAEGERALDFLADHPQTAQFICGKLARYFVSDTPAAATVSDCVTVFLANKGVANQIELVLRSLFASIEFNDPTNQRAKFRNNQEYLYSVARFLGWNAQGTPDSNGRLLNNALGHRAKRMGQAMYEKGEPDGWPEAGEAWTTTASAYGRFREGNEMVLEEGPYIQVISLVNYFTNLGITTPKDILAHLFMVLLGSHYDAEDIYLGYWVLQLDNGGTFTLADTDAEEKLEQLVARIIQLPEFSLH